MGLDDPHLAHFCQQLEHGRLIGGSVHQCEVRQLFDRVHLVVVRVDHRIDGAKCSLAEDAALLVGIDCMRVRWRAVGWASVRYS